MTETAQCSRGVTRHGLGFIKSFLSETNSTSCEVAPSGLDWWFGSRFDSLVLLEGKWETLPQPPNHRAPKHQIKKEIEALFKAVFGDKHMMSCQKSVLSRHMRKCMNIPSGQAVLRT